MSQFGKVKSFSLSSASKKVLNKRDLEKQKKIADEEAAAEAYQEFVATFEDVPAKGKLFVRGSVINSASGEEVSTKDMGQVYKPEKMQELIKKELKSDIKSDSTAGLSGNRINEKPPKKKGEQKKKSNLELFKEELKLIQEEREERHKLKAIIKEGGKMAPAKSDIDLGTVKLADEYRLPGSFDTGDPNTTNIYLGNINPKMSEQQLCQIFGKYGPLASVKIMWPRTDDERSRNRNCGFVAFMNRKDGERALKALSGKEIMNYEMKLGWGKAVPIPPHPIYIPPALMELTMPPPQSGLPFNAQPNPNLKIPREQWNDKENFEKVLQNAVVKVVIPTDRMLLSLIHRMIEFVVREGPMFEAMIMNREISNPTFRFLFDNQSPAHVYYRWRLFSILQGEQPSKWRTEEFRMFEDGSIWLPPPVNPFLQGMPDDLIEPSPPHSPERLEKQDEKPKQKKHQQSSSSSSSSSSRKESRYQYETKGMLSDSQRDKFEDLLRNLAPERNKIMNAMIYCIDHAEAAEEIIDCIAESLSITETPLYKKIARLYLISDILHNCTAKVTNASFYRKGFQTRLEQVFHDIHDCFQAIEGRLKAEQFKQRVMACFRAWEDWAIYSSDYLIKLQNIFLGLVQRQIPQSIEPIDDDVDGMPIADDVDIDGIPLSDDIDGEPMTSNQFDSSALKFKPSKWETIDPDVVESQAMTTSKWDLLEQTNDDDLDGQPYDPSPSTCDDSRGSQFLEQFKNELASSSSSNRAKLREIEVKVLKFQDELESGRRPRKPGVSISEQVEEYRNKLLKRDQHEYREKRKEHSSSPSSSSHKKRKSRSRSRSRSRSKSPKRGHHYHSHRKSPTRKRRSPSPYRRKKY